MFLSASDIAKRIPELSFPVAAYRADGSVTRVYRAQLSRLAVMNAVTGFGTKTRTKKLFIHPEDHGARLRRTQAAQSHVRLVHFAGHDLRTGDARRFQYYEPKEAK